MRKLFVFFVSLLAAAPLTFAQIQNPTATMYPPTAGKYSHDTVTGGTHGNTYNPLLGSPQQVPDYDVALLIPYGWTLINPNQQGGTGTVTNTSVVGANGFAGTVANATTTPAITLTTSVTGPLKGASGALAAATASDISNLYGGATGTGLTALQTSPVFITPALSGSSTGVTTLASANSGASNYTLTFPAITDTVDTLTATQTLSNKTLTSPVLTTPSLGAATATTINGDTFTTGTYTLTGGAGKTLTFNNSLTLAGTDATTMTFPASSGTVDTLNSAVTYTAVKTFTNSDLCLLGSSTGCTTFTSANASATNYTLTFPALTDTIATLNAGQTFINANTWTLTQAANTSVPAINLIDTTAATTGNQQYSPALVFQGNGYGTTGAASQPTAFKIENQPAQGTTAAGQLVFSYSNNGAAYTVFGTMVTGTTNSFNLASSFQANNVRVLGSSAPTNGIYMPVTNVLGFSSNSTEQGFIDANGNLALLHAHADQSKSVQTPTTGFSITVANNISTLYLTPAGTLATGTITMPTTPIDGQQIQFGSTQTITALTVSANTGQSISGAPTTLSANTGFEYIYNLATTTWLRLR